MKRPFAFLFVASLTSLVACTFPFTRRSHGVEESTSEAPVVQIREYPHSPTVAIVAWSPDENEFGLTAQLRRDGSLIEDHQLYVSTWYDGGMSLTNVALLRGKWRVAQTVVPAKRLLLSTGVSRDPYHCFWGTSCSPYEVRGLRVPDGLLRENRDSVAVRLYGLAGREIVVTVHKPLIDAYLSTVDSVANALRRSR